MRYFAAAYALVQGLFSFSASAEESRAVNQVSIEQIGSGNRVYVRQQSSDEQSTYIEQEVTDENGNRALVVQQGNTNITDLTQQGRLNNVYNTGTVLAPGTTQNNVQVEQLAPSSGTPATVTTQ